MSVTGTSKYCAQIEISVATPTKFANKTRQTTTMNCILKGNGSVGTFGYFLATSKCRLLAHPSIARKSRYLAPRPRNLPIKVVKQRQWTVFRKTTETEIASIWFLSKHCCVSLSMYFCVPDYRNCQKEDQKCSNDLCDLTKNSRENFDLKLVPTLNCILKMKFKSHVNRDTWLCVRNIFQ